MPDTATEIHHGSYLMPSLEHATVSDAMHPGILSCEPDATATEVARLMAERVEAISLAWMEQGPAVSSVTVAPLIPDVIQTPVVVELKEAVMPDGVTLLNSRSRQTEKTQPGASTGAAGAPSSASR